MLAASELIARSALLREKGHGTNYRADFPNTDNAKWLKNIYTASDTGGPKFWTVDVKLTRMKP